MMHFGLSLTPFGHDPTAWSQVGREPLGFEGLLAQVLQAERAGFDFVWLADQGARRPTDTLSPLATPFEPTTLVSALSTKAKTIGFLAAAATYQHEPYNLARRIASLDTISKGRAGWTVVTGTDEARDREYVEVVRALWDSWEDDAFIYDKASSRFFVPQKMHVQNHKGAHFSVRGPLNVNRSPQGRPVLAADARSPVADLADVIFVDASTDITTFQSKLRIFRIVTDFAGTPIEITDRLQRDFEENGLHGFVLTPPTLAAFAGFVEAVAPELRRRGLIGKAATGATLRERLGLAFPHHPAAVTEHAL
jgi:alkanesulfonate monooxygenase SsuD/methylene tetrahydromethanopterin reductase-like flavin-dependent oxidoreductase (luciferase family)